MTEFPRFSRLSELSAFLEEALSETPGVQVKDGGVIAEGYDSELDALRKLAKGGKEELAEMQAREIQKTGVSSLKIKFNNVFGYFFEVPASQAQKLPDYFVRRQTLVNAERFITPELKVFEERILSAEQEVLSRESALFEEILQKTLLCTQKVQHAARTVAETDLLFSFAKTAKAQRFTCPEHSKNGTIEIQNGRHPVVEKFLRRDGKSFVPNHLGMGENSAFHLITGPNMAGKSTFLRQNALILYLFHLGSFVPAEKATLPLVDRIFTRIGAGDSLATGESTFLVEMQESANILRHATKDSFVILDEIGRGTSTTDGLSIAWAMVEYLHEKSVKTLFATHYHELISLADSLPRAENFSVQVLENTTEGVVFLHTILKGGAEKSFGVEVAKLAGIPPSVVARAEDILEALEKTEKTPAERGSQISLFGEAVSPVAKRSSKALSPKQASPLEDTLRKMDLHNLTPLKALEFLYTWREKI